MTRMKKAVEIAAELEREEVWKQSRGRVRRLPNTSKRFLKTMENFLKGLSKTIEKGFRCL